MTAAELTCRDFVELATDYLEDRMAAEERARLERHLAVCKDCRTYLDQMRQTLATLGRLSLEDLSPAAREELMAVFRAWRAQR